MRTAFGTSVSEWWLLIIKLASAVNAISDGTICLKKYLIRTLENLSEIAWYPELQLILGCFSWGSGIRASGCHKNWFLAFALKLLAKEVGPEFEYQ
jgi:hypothetical protein